MNAINFSNKKQEKETIPHKIKHFLFSEDDENLYHEDLAQSKAWSDQNLLGNGKFIQDLICF